MSVASGYWLDGFSRVWQEDAGPDEDVETRAWYRDLLARYQPRTVQRTLDVGSGSGCVTSVLAQLYPSAFHVAADGCEAAVALTRRRMELERNAGVVRQLDVTCAGFSRALREDYGTFDVITCFFVLHHYPPATIARVLAELRGLLAVGGVIVLAECHDPTDARAAAAERTCAELARLAGQPPDLLLTPDELMLACRQAGCDAGEVQFDLCEGRPFTAAERARHAATLAQLRGRVATLIERAGPVPSPELSRLEALVDTMAAESICGHVRHPLALAVLRRTGQPASGDRHDA